MLDVDDIGPADEELLDLLREGRVTAPYAASETGYSLQYVRDRLSRLVEHGNAQKVYEGLYELIEDPREERDEEAAEEPREEPPQPPEVDRVDEGGETADVREQLEDALPGSGDKLDARVDAILRMYDHLQQREGEKVRAQDLKDLVDADDVEYSSVDSFWTNALKQNAAQGRPNALTLLPGVEELGNGRYRHMGGTNA